MHSELLRIPVFEMRRETSSRYIPPSQAFPASDEVLWSQYLGSFSASERFRITVAGALWYKSIVDQHRIPRGFDVFGSRLIVLVLYGRYVAFNYYLLFNE